jgi:hypothetical protein
MAMAIEEAKDGAASGKQFGLQLRARANDQLLDPLG